MTDTTAAPLPPPGYRDVSIPLTDITAKATLAMIPLIVLPLVPYWLIYGWDAFWSNAFNDSWLFFIGALIIGIIAHEGVHAIGWKFAGGLSWSDLSFGIDKKTLSPYCHAKAPMKTSAYRLGAVLPSLVTGLLPILIGTAIAHAPLTFVGAVLFSAAVGDFLILWIIRDVHPDALVLDHPKNAGCYVKDAG
jgi:uncharacterized membrane protein (DUF4010 family)